ncbi:F-box/LRR-repeat protein At3g26922-like [Corylus avellana]|uniref:F-box/LRR-repeat protein At3g26922-like n=1 Tax=Corylus avellana TaxID=13451 RepID=UPI00286AE6A3|nr:F-box/LRR-repeat protein At3g26922-like [Corylus avellana]
METTCVIPKPRLNEEEDIDGNSKSLGKLPEEVLRHILSFLPIEDAARTSVLSKRWEYLWASIPNLDFLLLRSAKRDITLFMNFVDRVLSLRKSSVIKRFTLCCYVILDASRVSTWISATVRHKVQELRIELHDCKGVFSLPYCLFTCETLISLHLDMPCILKLPTTICFSNLKILTIENVTFSDEYLTQQFFSGLPVLENLKLCRCGWGHLKVMRISSPKLHFLSIVESHVQTSSFKDGCRVIIVGGSLKEFHYNGCLFNDYCLHESFSLEKAEIDTFILDKSKKNGYRMYKLLSSLSNVKFLKLSNGVLEVLIYATKLLPRMPMFNNLVSLLFDGLSVDLDSEALLNILQRSPCLEKLEFLAGIALSSNCEEDDWVLDPVPSCFLSHLKYIKVDTHDGNKEEFSAIKILLKNSLVLEEMVMTCTEYTWSFDEFEHFFSNVEKNLEKHSNLRKQLEELPRGSQNYSLRFYKSFLKKYWGYRGTV